MSWLSRSSDERLVRAMETRREVQRGPLPREGSLYVDEPLMQARAAVHLFSITTVFLLILVFLLIAATAYYAQYSGALRWLIFGGVVGLAGLMAVRYVGGFVRDPTPLEARDLEARGIGGDLRRVRTTLQRADDGLAYSQLVFEDRLRKAFLQKVRVGRGLPPEALEDRSLTPEGVYDVVGDRDLTLFVLKSARTSRMYPAQMPVPPKRREFAQRVATLLDRMEAWR